MVSSSSIRSHRSSSPTLQQRRMARNNAVPSVQIAATAMSIELQMESLVAFSPLDLATSPRSAAEQSPYARTPTTGLRSVGEDNKDDETTREEGPVSPASSGNSSNSSTSPKLDELRERNRLLRENGNEQIARTRSSLQASPPRSPSNSGCRFFFDDNDTCNAVAETPKASERNPDAPTPAWSPWIPQARGSHRQIEQRQSENEQQQQQQQRSHETREGVAVEREGVEVEPCPHSMVAEHYEDCIVPASYSSSSHSDRTGSYDNAPQNEESTSGGSSKSIEPSASEDSSSSADLIALRVHNIALQCRIQDLESTNERLAQQHVSSDDDDDDLGESTTRQLFRSASMDCEISNDSAKAVPAIPQHKQVAMEQFDYVTTLERQLDESRRFNKTLTEVCKDLHCKVTDLETSQYALNGELEEAKVRERHLKEELDKTTSRIDCGDSVAHSMSSVADTPRGRRGKRQKGDSTVYSTDTSSSLQGDEEKWNELQSQNSVLQSKNSQLLQQMEEVVADKQVQATKSGKKIRHLQDKVIKLERVNREYESVKAKRKSEEEDRPTIEIEVEVLRDQLQAASSQAVQNQEQVVSLQQKLDDAKRMHEIEVAKLKDDHEQKVQSLREENQKTREAKKKSIRRIQQSHEQQVASFQQQLQTLTQTHDSMVKIKEDHEQEVQTLRHKLDQTIEENKENINQVQQCHDEKLTQAHSRIVYLERQDQDQKSKIETLQGEMKFKQALEEQVRRNSVAMLATERSMADAKHTALESDKKALKDELQEASIEAAEYRTQIATLETKLAEAEQEHQLTVQEKEEENSTLRQKILHASHAVLKVSRDMQSDIDILEEKNRVLQQQTERELEQERDSQCEIQERLTRNARTMLSTERAMAEAQCSFLKGDCLESEGKLLVLGEDVNNQDKKLRSCRLELMNLRALSGSQETQIHMSLAEKLKLSAFVKDLKRRLESATAMNKNLQLEIESQRIEQTFSSDSIGTRSGDLDQLSLGIQSSSSGTVLQLQEAVSQIASLEYENYDLQSRLNEAETRLLSNSEDQAEQQSPLSSANEATDENQSAFLRTQIAHLQRELGSASSLNIHFQSRIKELEDELLNSRESMSVEIAKVRAACESRLNKEKSDAVSMQQENERLEAEIEASKEETQTRHAIEESLRKSSTVMVATERAMATATMTALESEVSSLREELNLLVDKDLQNQRANNGLRQHMSKRIRQVQEHKRMYDKVQGENTKLKQKLLELSQVIMSLSKEMQNKTDSMEQQNQRFQAQFETELVQQMTGQRQLQDQLKRNTAVLIATERSVAEAKCSALLSENRSFRATMAEESEKHEIINSDLTSLMKQNAELKQQLKEHEDELVTQRDMHEQLNRSSSSIVATERAMQEGRIATLEAEVARLRDQFLAASNQATAYFGQIQSLQLELQSAESKNESQLAHIGGMHEVEMKKTHDKVDLLLQEKEELGREIQALNEELASRHALEARIQRSSIAMAQTERAMADAKYSTLECKIQGLQERCYELEGRENDYRATCGRLHCDFLLMKNQSQNQNRKLNGANEQNGKLKKKLLELSQVIIQISRSTQNKLDSLQKRNQRLEYQHECELREERASRSEIMTMFARSTSSMIYTERAIATANTTALCQDLRNTEGRLEYFEEGFLKVNKRVDDLRRDLRETQTENVSFKSALINQSANSTRLLEARDTRIRTLQEENNDLSVRLRTVECNLRSQKETLEQSRRSAASIAQTERAIAEARIQMLQLEENNRRDQLELASSQLLQAQAQVEALQLELRGVYDGNRDKMLRMKAEYETQVEKAEKETKSLRAEKEELLLEIATCEKNLKAKRKTEACTRRTFSAIVYTERAMLDARDTKAEAEKAEIRSKLCDITTICSAYHQQNQRIANELSQRDKSLAESTAKIQRFESENHALKSRLLAVGWEKSMVDARCSSLESELGKLRTDYTGIVPHVANLEKTNVALRHELQQNSDEISNKTESIRKLHTENEHLKSKLRDLSKMIYEVSGDMKQSVVGLERQKKELSLEYEMLLDRERMSKSDIQCRLTRSAKTMVATERSMAQARCTLLDVHGKSRESTLISKERDMQSEISELLNSKRQLWSQLDGLRDEVTDKEFKHLSAQKYYQKQNEKLKVESERLETSIESMSIANERTRHTYAAIVDTERAMADAKLSCLESNLNNLKENSDVTKQELWNLQKRHEDLKDDLRRYQHDNMKYQGVTKELQAESLKLKINLLGLSRTVVRVSKEMQVQIDSSERENNILRDELEALQKTEHAARVEIQERLSRNVATMLSTERALSSAKQADLQRLLKSALDRVDETEAISKASEKECRDLITFLHTEIQSLQEQVTRASGDNKDLQEKVRSMKVEKDGLMTKIYELSDVIYQLSQHMQENMASLQQENRRLQTEFELERELERREQVEIRNKLSKTSATMLATERARSNAAYSYLLADLNQTRENFETMGSQFLQLGRDLSLSEESVRHLEDLTSSLRSQINEAGHTIEQLHDKDKKSQLHISDLVEQNDRLRNELQSEIGQRETAECTMANLVIEKEEAHRLLTQAETKFNLHRGIYGESRRRLESVFEAEKASSREQSTNLMNELNDCKQELALSSEMLDSSQKNAASLEKDMKSMCHEQQQELGRLRGLYESRLNSASSKIDHLEQQMQEQESVIHEMKSEIASKQANEDRMRHSTGAIIATEKAAARAMCSALESDIAQLRNEVGRVTIQAAECRDENDILKQRLSRSESENQQQRSLLESERSAATAERSGFENDIARLEAELGSATDSASKYQSLSEDLKNQLMKSEAENEEKCVKIARLEADLGGVTESASEYKHLSENLKNQLMKSETENEGKRNTIARLDAELGSATESASKYQTLSENLKNQLVESETKNEEKSGTIQEIQDIAEAERSAFERKNGHLELQLESATEEISEYRDVNTELEKKLARIQTENNEKDEEIQKFQAQNSALKSKLVELSQVIGHLSTEMQNSVDGLQKQKDDLQEELENELAAERCAQRDLQDRLTYSTRRMVCTERARAQGERDCLESTVKRLQEELDCQKNIVASVEEQLASARKRQAEADQYIDFFKTSFADVSKKLKNTMLSYSETQLKLRKSEQQLNVARSETSKYMLKAEETQKTLNEAMGHNATLEQDQKLLSAQIEEISKANAEVEEESGRLRHALAAKESELEMSAIAHRSSLSAVSSSLADSQARNTALQGDIKELNERLEAQTASSTELNKSLELAIADKSSSDLLSKQLTTEKEVLTNNLKEAHADVASLSDEVRQTFQKLHDTQLEKDALEETLQRRTSELEVSQNHAQELKNHLNDVQAVADDAQEQNDCLRATSQKEIDDMRSALAEHTEELRICNGEASTLRTRIAGLESELQQTNDEKENLEQQLFERQEEVEDAQCENADLQHLIENQDRQIRQLEDDVSDRDEQLRRKQSRFDEMKASLASITGVLEEMTDSNTALASRINDLEAQLESERESKVQILAEKDANSMEKESSLAEASSQIEVIRSENRRLEQQVKNLEEEMELAKGAAKDTEAELSAAREAAENANARREALASELESQRHAAEENDNALKEQITECRKEISEEKFANTVFKDLITTLNTKNDSLQSHCEKLRADRTRLKEQYKAAKIQQTSRFQPFPADEDDPEEPGAIPLVEERNFLRHNRMRGASQNKAEERLDMVIRERDSLVEREQDLQKKVEDLVATNKEMDAKLSSKESRTSKRLESALERNKWLDEQLAETKKTVTELTKDIEKMTVDHAQKLAHSENREASLAKEVVGLQLEIETMKRKTGQSGRADKDTFKETENLRIELAKLKKENETLVAERDSLQSIREEVESKSSLQVQANIEELQAALSRNKWLDEQLMEAERSFAELSNSTDEMRRAFADDLHYSEAREASLAKEVVSLQLQVESTKRKLAQFESNPEGFQHKMNELRADVTYLTKQSEVLAAERESLRSSHESMDARACRKQSRPDIFTMSSSSRGRAVKSDEEQPNDPRQGKSVPFWRR